MKKPAKQAGWVAPIVAARQGKPPPAKKKPPPAHKPPPGHWGIFAAAAQAAAKNAPAKAAKKAKQHPKAKKHPVRKLALGEGVACCSAEALAASLRLSGRPVSDDDVLELYWRTASDPDAGASILATLRAAAEFGLAGCRPQWYMTKSKMAPAVPVRMTAAAQKTATRNWRSMSVILGVDLPGPHAVLATPDGWHSWGELYDPACWPDAVIEEAWEVTWPVIR